MKQAIILAAGEGQRLRPFTVTKPKGMISIADKPILQYVIEALAQKGIRKIIIVVGYRREQIFDYFGSGEQFGVDIKYLIQERQLGTAHALTGAKDFVEDEISLAVDDSLEVCFDSMENQFPSISITYEDYITEVNILENSVKFKTSTSITLESETKETSAQIEFKQIEVKSDINNMMNIADYYVSSQIVNKDLICIDCITELAENSNLNVDILNYIDNLIIISIYSKDETSYPVSFNFLEAYNLTIQNIPTTQQSSFPEFTKNNQLNLIAPGK